MADQAGKPAPPPALSHRAIGSRFFSWLSWNMLIELRIKNYAVIDDIAVSLGPGLNVLTGETGAGKSIIVGALSLLLGERASVDVVREGADRAVVEGVFDIGRHSRLLSLLADQGIHCDDGLLVFRREVAAQGRNRAWLNGSATTAGQIGQLGGLLVDMHGQHEHQALLSAEEQRTILDAYGGHTELSLQVRETARLLNKLKADLEQLKQQRQVAADTADELRRRVEEIEAAKVIAGEDTRLEEELRRLAHAEELAQIAGALHSALYAADESIIARLDVLRRSMQRLVAFDPEQKEAEDLLEESYFGLEEVGRRMGDYARTIDQDPNRLEQVRSRQDLLSRLKIRYGPTLDDVMEAGRQAREELDLIDAGVLDQTRLEREIAGVDDRLRQMAGELSELRREAGARLGEEINAVLPALGLEGGRFEVALQPLESVGAQGGESVEFRVALNVGFESRPLRRVASGGEISRIMLAIKSILARVDSVPTLVFDEIDAGIGGTVAHQIAIRLFGVAQHHQVLVITHLAQIACRAHQHLNVDKGEDLGQSVTRLTLLDDDSRVAELARMLGGGAHDSASIQHARELLAGCGNVS